VWSDYLPPGLQPDAGLAFDRGTSAPALLASDLFVEAYSQQLHLYLFDFFRLRCRDSREQSACRVQRAVGVIASEGLLMRPAIAKIPQFAHEGALRLAQRLSEDHVPLIPHDREERRRIPLWLAFSREEMRLSIRYSTLNLFKPELRVLGFHLP